MNRHYSPRRYRDLHATDAVKFENGTAKLDVHYVLQRVDDCYSDCNTFSESVGDDRITRGRAPKKLVEQARGWAADLRLQLDLKEGEYLSAYDDAGNTY